MGGIRLKKEGRRAGCREKGGVKLSPLPPLLVCSVPLLGWGKVSTFAQEWDRAGQENLPLINVNRLMNTLYCL